MKENTAARAKIDNILDGFNFGQVQEVMYDIPGRWWKGKDGGVPTISELRTHAENLLLEILDSDKDIMSISTGGFHVHRWPWPASDDGEDYGLELIFALEVWDA